MPNKITTYFLLTICLLFSIQLDVKAQKIYIDSLKNQLKTVSVEEKPFILVELSKYEGEKTCKQAIDLAKKTNNNDALLFSYTTMAYLYTMKNLKVRAKTYLDSATTVSTKAKSNIYKGYLSYRKGWFEVINGKDAKGMAYFIQAIKLLETSNDKLSHHFKTAVYNYVASIYSYGTDTAKHARYAQKCLLEANKSGYPGDKVLGLFTYGQGFLSAFERNTKNRKLVDSAMFYFRSAINFYNQNKERIPNQPIVATSALNLASIYLSYFPLGYKDSVLKYVNIALPVARKSKEGEIIANCYGILSEYAQMEKDYKAAEFYLLGGLSELDKVGDSANITRSRLMLGLAKVAENSGDLKKALDYYKGYNQFYAKTFDLEKLSITQQLEEDYQASQRQNEIIRLKERADYNKRLNWLYIAIGSAGILSLALLLYSYHFKLKSSIQQAKLVEKQKEETDLKLKLQQAEAEKLALEKQEAELIANLKAEESAKLEAQKALLQDRTEWLEKELLTGTLKIEEKNGILNLLKEKSNQPDSANAAQIGRIINQNLRKDKELDEEQALRHIHPDFFSALQIKANNGLTRLDLKYCAYILIGLDNKDIAARLGIEPKSIRMARYRIKRKLKLDKEANLDQHIRDFEKTKTINA